MEQITEQYLEPEDAEHEERREEECLALDPSGTHKPNAAESAPNHLASDSRWRGLDVPGIRADLGPFNGNRRRRRMR